MQPVTLYVSRFKSVSSTYLIAGAIYRQMREQGKTIEIGVPPMFPLELPPGSIGVSATMVEDRRTSQRNFFSPNSDWILNHGIMPLWISSLPHDAVSELTAFSKVAGYLGEESARLAILLVDELIGLADPAANFSALRWLIPSGKLSPELTKRMETLFFS